MSETVEIFGTSYGVFEMTHADKVHGYAVRRQLRFRLGVTR